jgi:hypothetical protein
MVHVNMTRDYAKRGKYKSSLAKKKSSYFRMWLFVLVVFGLFTVGLVYFGKNQQLRKLYNFKSLVKEKEQLVAKVKELPIPKVDFYTMLPEKKLNKSTQGYELEIALVDKYATADRLKAELALIGFVASIAPIRKNGAQVYEVSVGPYDSKDMAIADLEKLKQNKISSKLKKYNN